MKKLLIALMITAIAGIGSSKANICSDTKNTFKVGNEQTNGILIIASENEIKIVSDKVKERIVQRILKNKGKWKKGRRILRKHNRKFRKLKRRVHLNQSRPRYK